jgi:hypothetical protein
VADGRSTPGPGQKNDGSVDIWKKNRKDRRPKSRGKNEKKNHED